MTGKPTVRRGLAIRTVVASVIVLIVVAAAACFANVRTEFHGTYICAQCGAEETVDRRSIAGIAYHEDRTVRETAVSRALSGHGKRRCQHAWYLSRYARSWGSLFEWQGVADGGLMFSVMRQLLDDGGFARELGEMPNARDVWSALSKAEQASPQETELLLSEWWIEGPDRPPFARWWAENEKPVRRLGASSRQGA